MITGFFPRDAAERHHVIDRDTTVGEALHNGAGAEGGGGNQPAEQRRGVGGEVEIGNDPF